MWEDSHFRTCSIFLGATHNSADVCGVCLSIQSLVDDFLKVGFVVDRFGFLAGCDFVEDWD